MRTSSVSNDPNFEEKLIDVVEPYLDPTERAGVFGFDGKTQVQALDRTQWSLPKYPCRTGGMTHDDTRRGMLDPFAALNTATSEIITDYRHRHKGADVLPFFETVDNVPARMARKVTEWLAEPAQARWRLQFTTTCSSWLNLVER